MPRGFAHGVGFRKFGGSVKRLSLLRTLVNALIKHERIETTFAKAYETQKYMDRVIDIAKYGESNKYCNDMLQFWIQSEEAKGKLFNVLLPRYSQYNEGYTRWAMLPEWCDSETHNYRKMAVLELKGNPLPPLPIKQENPHTLQNVLIAAAKQDWDYKKQSNTTD